jgi:hypothetical protein
MGEKLMKYYNYIGEKKGLVGKMELSAITLMPRNIAAIEPDNEENIQKFKKAIEKLTGTPAPNFE